MGNGSMLGEGRTRAGDVASPCMPKMKPLSPMVPLCAYLLLFVLVVVLSHCDPLQHHIKVGVLGKLILLQAMSELERQPGCSPRAARRCAQP